MKDNGLEKTLVTSKDQKDKLFQYICELSLYEWLYGPWLIRSELCIPKRKSWSIWWKLGLASIVIGIGKSGFVVWFAVTGSLFIMKKRHWNSFVCYTMFVSKPFSFFCVCGYLFCAEYKYSVFSLCVFFSVFVFRFSSETDADALKPSERRLLADEDGVYDVTYASQTSFVLTRCFIT